MIASSDVVFFAPDMERQLRRSSPSSDGIAGLESLRAQAALAVLLVVLVSLFIIVVLIVIREFVREANWRESQGQRFREGGHRGNEPRPGSISESNDYEVSNEPSSSSRNELRRQRLENQRFVRRSWYEHSLKNFVHTLKEDDLVSDEDRGDEWEEDAISVMIPNGRGGSRKLDGTCSICFGQFQVGDRVVRSPLGVCVHVFCEECLMSWLSRGKKKCPTCRLWFVTSASIESQVKEEFDDVESSETASPSSFDEEGGFLEGVDVDSLEIQEI